MPSLLKYQQSKSFWNHLDSILQSFSLESEQGLDRIETELFTTLSDIDQASWPLVNLLQSHIPKFVSDGQLLSFGNKTSYIWNEE
jgi:hypothetical protein